MQEQRETIDLTKIPMEGDAAAVHVYVNNAEALIAPWDIRIVFSEVTGNGSGEKLRKILRANVVMAPSHAKALAAAMALAVKQYEGVFGEIRMPAGAEASPNPQ